MAKFRYINTAIWDDEWFTGLDALEQHLFIYFLTNTQTNITGVYQISIRRVAFDTGMDQEKVKKIIDRFKEDGKLFYELGYIVLKNWQKHQSLNPNQAMAVVTHVNSLPLWLRQRLADPKDSMFIDFESHLNGTKALESLSEPWQTVRTNPNSNSNSNLEPKGGIERGSVKGKTKAPGTSAKRSGADTPLPPNSQIFKISDEEGNLL